jgi:hypothetical protein
LGSEADGSGGAFFFIKETIGAAPAARDATESYDVG